MKRLVTLGITLALVMGLFCFSVYADNIVIQGESDTVTTTYGDNDITIALRARKLRVINTGTAAAGYAGYTPVIVSITIYNLGNQNCLVNNLKFRLTSESAEYRIAGFENISPDLFISDTAYDATGYLSLKASNDYTYAGGFVVPANSNMTYVGIINVSANWITENQTWRTVDLSTATFYENLTSTVGDYPCAAEPVDLSNIESSIGNIVTAVSGIDYDVSTIHTLISNLVNIETYSGVLPGYTLPDRLRSNARQLNYVFNGYGVDAYRIIGAPSLIDSTLVLDPTSDSYVQTGTVRYPFYIYVETVNNTGSVIDNYIYNRIDGVFPSSVVSNVVIDTFISNIYSSINIPSTGRLLLYSKFPNGSTHGLIPEGVTNVMIFGHIDMPYPSSVSFPEMTINNWFTGTPTLLSDYYLPPNEYSILRDLYIAYSTVNGIDDLSDQANEAADQAETIHNQEASYYAQNQAAIEATGLNNFQFSGEQSNGIGSVSNDFTALWNALGSWNSVYIFSMTLTLALTILRHMPNRRRPKEDKKE